MNQSARARYAHVAVWGLLMLIATLSARRLGAQQTDAQWFVELDTNPRFLVVYLDARQKRSNVTLYDVSYKVQLRHPDGRQDEINLPFPETGRPIKIPSLYVARIDLKKHMPVSRVVGISLAWNWTPNGGKNDSSGAKATTAPPPPVVIAPLPARPTVASMADVYTASAARWPSALAGRWHVRVDSDVAHNTNELLADLRIDGEQISGELQTSDGTAKALTGRAGAQGDSLDLVRETGLNTTQHYRLLWNGTALSGRYWNEGRYPDHGSVILRR